MAIHPSPDDPIWRDRDHARKAWTLAMVASQAVTLYEELQKEAKAKGDAQGENFWESHALTARLALEHANVRRCSKCGTYGDDRTRGDGGEMGTGRDGQPVHRGCAS